MFVCCESCVLSGKGLRDGLITRPEESYRLWRIVVCDQESSNTRRLKPATGLWKIQPQWVVMPGKQTQTDMKINKLEKTQTQNQEFHEQFYPRVINKTDISFSNDELSLLSKGLKYNLSYKHKNWIETLALEAETAVSYLLTAEQDYIQYQVAHNIRQLYKQYNGNHDYNTLDMKRERHTLNKFKDKIRINNAMISKADKETLL
jgi:hypothetical protein